MMLIYRSIGISDGPLPQNQLMPTNEKTLEEWSNWIKNAHNYKYISSQILDNSCSEHKNTSKKSLKKPYDKSSTQKNLLKAKRNAQIIAGLAILGLMCYIIYVNRQYIPFLNTEEKNEEKKKTIDKTIDNTIDNTIVKDKKSNIVDANKI